MNAHNAYKNSIFVKKPVGDSSAAKYIIQTLGHHRRRSAELKINKQFIKENVQELMHNLTDDQEKVDIFDYEVKIRRLFSNRWDYY
jgi:hypothetical protein